MVRVAAVLAAASLTYACFSKPDAPSGQVVGDGGQTVDAKIDDAPGSGSSVAGCPYDMFDGSGAPCGTWGSSFGSGGGVTRTSSTLHVLPAVPSGNGVGCISNSTFDFSQGVSVDLQQILDGAMTYTTFFEVQSAANTSQFVRVNIEHTTGGVPMITTSCLGAGSQVAVAIPYDIAVHRFLQFKPSATANAIDVLAHGDGGTFTPLQTAACTWSNPPTMVKIRIGAFSGADVASTAAVFDSLSCP